MKLYAKTPEIDMIVNKLLTTSQLNIKNITASGAVDAADGIFDVGSLGSCTVVGNLNVGSLNWKGISFITLDVLTAGGGHTQRTFFIQG